MTKKFNYLCWILLKSTKVPWLETPLLIFIVGVSYTMLYNYLDFPAGVVPITTVTKEDDEELKKYKGHYEDMWDKVFVKVCSLGCSRCTFVSQCFDAWCKKPLSPQLCCSFRQWRELWDSRWLSSVWLCHGRRSCVSGSWRRWRSWPVKSRENLACDAVESRRRRRRRASAESARHI